MNTVATGQDWPDKGVIGIRLSVGEPDLDLLLAELRQQSIRRQQVMAWLPRDGALISNLRVWENILLGVTYLRNSSGAEAFAALELMLQGSDFGADETRRQWLDAPVAALSIVGRVQVAMLRTALMRPDVVVAEAQALILLASTGQFWRERIDLLLSSSLFVIVASPTEQWPDFVSDEIIEKEFPHARK